MKSADERESGLFREALQRALGAVRGGFLLQACTGDPALRGRREALLQAHKNPDPFLEPPRSRVGVASRQYQDARPLVLGFDPANRRTYSHRMAAPLATISQAALNPHRLALKVIRQPRLLPAIIEGLKADKPRVKYGCAKALRLISEQRPDRLYRFFDFFVGLLDHENRILQWEAHFVLSQLARADDEDKVADVFDKYFSPISGPVMITAANVILGGARIARAKPRLADRIATEILKVGRAHYQTAECRHVAIGHAIAALGEILPFLGDPRPAVKFVRRQTRNPRPATRKKAEHFLNSRLGRFAPQ